MSKQFKAIILVIVIIIGLTGCGNKLDTINSIKDLENKNIGVTTGSEYDSIVNKHIKNANVMYYNSYNDQISALKSGKIDGFLTDEPLAKEMLTKNEGIKVLDKKLTEDSYAFAITPSKKELQEEVNTQLSNMKENGKLKEFEDKWFGNDESKKILEKHSYSSNKTIKFATVSGSAPFAYMKNNQIVGYDIDIIQYICKELGYKLEVIEMSFEGIIPALKSGKVDMAGCSIIVTEERKKSVLFSDPDYTGGIVVVVRS